MPVFCSTTRSYSGADPSGASQCVQIFFSLFLTVLFLLSLSLPPSSVSLLCFLPQSGFLSASHRHTNTLTHTHTHTHTTTQHISSIHVHIWTILPNLLVVRFCYYSSFGVISYLASCMNHVLCHVCVCVCVCVCVSE